MEQTNTRYVSMLHIYKARRSRLKNSMMNKYSWDGLDESQPVEYQEKVKLLNERIDLLTKEKELLNQKEKWVSAVMKHVENYFGVVVITDFKDVRSPKKVLGRQVLSKYVLENCPYSITSKNIANVLNCSPDRPGKARLSLTRSYKEHPENREIYNRFTEYIKSQEELPVKRYHRAKQLN